MPRVLLIVNPFSSGVTPARLERVEWALRSVAEVERRETEARGHATELASAAAGVFDAIVVYSGDGTYNEAVNGASGGVPFGFVPGGGASVFPRALGLPRDAAGAARGIAGALAAGRTRTVTLGVVNGRRFLFAAGIGPDAEAVRRIDARGRRADGRRPGNLAFGLAVAGVLLAHRLRIEPRLEVAGHGRAAFVLVANGRPYTYAGPVPLTLARDATFEDGLDFVAPRELRPLATPGLLARALRGTAAAAPGVLAGHDLDAFAVRCDRPLPLQADGEDLGDVVEASFVAERGALRVLA
ncbi:MAG TPA: diacylglycerol kinase family protein [Gaiellaceae bacterium]|nr:diacylglycerol kinase family protein [Gaiellaceae bacterium]